MPLRALALVYIGVIFKIMPSLYFSVEMTFYCDFMAKLLVSLVTISRFTYVSDGHGFDPHVRQNILSLRFGHEKISPTQPTYVCKQGGHWSGKSQGNLIFLQSQGKVKEFCKLVREILNIKTSGNFIIWAKNIWVVAGILSIFKCLKMLIFFLLTSLAR